MLYDAQELLHSYFIISSFIIIISISIFTIITAMFMNR